VSPRTHEAFGGSSNTAEAITRLLKEFRSNNSDFEQCAIVGVEGQGDHAFRIWSNHGSEEEVVVPFAEIVQILAADRDAYGYGWVFAHTHKYSKSPSGADNSATCALAWIGKLLDVPLVDHWIYTLDDPSFFSYSKGSSTHLRPAVRFEIEDHG